MFNKKWFLVLFSLFLGLLFCSSAKAAPDFTTGLNVSAGNVGIGTTNPGTYKLYVNGTSFFNNTLNLRADYNKTLKNYFKQDDTESFINIDDSMTTAEVVEALGRGTNITGFTKVDDPTAPAPGAFEVSGYQSLDSIGPYWKVDQDSEYIFETWIKVVSSTATTQRFYAGWNMYDANKASFGNIQRYWGSSGTEYDSNSYNDGQWHHIVARISGVGGSVGQFINGTEYAKIVLLFNYNQGDTITRFAGMKLYKSKKIFTSIYAKNGSHSTVDSDGKLVMDYNGNIFASNLQSSGSLGVGSVNTPNDIFSIANTSGTHAPAISSRTGHNYTSTYVSTDKFALANYGLVESLINSIPAPLAGTSTYAVNADKLDNYHSTSFAGYVSGVADIKNISALPSLYTFFSSAANPTNGPIVTSWIQGIQFPLANNPDYRQIIASANSNLYYISQGGGTWGAWRTIYDSGNLTNGLSSNYITKWNGSKLVNSLIYDNGSSVGIGVAGSQKLVVGDITGQNTLRINGLSTSNMAPVLSLFRSGSAEWVVASHGANFLIGANPGGYADANLSTSAKLVIDSSGKVGIGTTAPSDKLHIENSSVGTGDIFMRISKAYDSSAVNRKSGIILGTNATNYGNSWKIVSESDSGYMNNANLFFKWSVGGVDSTKMTIDSTGNVGIGGTTPNDIFSISNASGVHAPSGSSRTGHNYTNTYLSTDKYALVNYGLVETMVGNSSYWTRVGNNLYPSVIDNNVGIGTTNPTAKLSVHSTSTDVATFRGVNSLNYGTFKIIGGTATSPYWRGSFIGANIKMTSTYPDIETTGYRASAIGFGSDSGEGHIGFFTTSATTSGSVLNENVRINNNGNVGIGTVSPAAKLQINPQTGVEGLRIISSNYSPLVIRDSTNSNDYLRVYQWGLVNTPRGLTSNDISVYPGYSNLSWNYDSLYIGNHGWYSGDELGIVEQYNGYNLITHDYGAGSSGKLFVGNSITEDRGTGNVGVGTTNPGTKLDVNGSINLASSGKLGFGGVNTNWMDFTSNYFRLLMGGSGAAPLKVGGLVVSGDYGATAPTTGAYIQGNLGVGVSSPAHKLTVLGGYIDYQPVIGLYAATASGNTATRNWAFLANYVTYGDFGIMQSNVRDGNPVYGTTRFYIKDNGYIGIGTTNPRGKLDISDYYVVDQVAKSSSWSGAGSDSPLFVPLGLFSTNSNIRVVLNLAGCGYGNSGLEYMINRGYNGTPRVYYMGPSSYGTAPRGLDSNVTFYYKNTTETSFNLGVDVAGGCNDSSRSVYATMKVVGIANFSSVDNNKSNYTALSAYQYIYNGFEGNVGIGVTNPEIKLAIGDSDTGLNWAGDGQLDVWSNYQKSMSFRNGNVSIGTTSTTYKLTVGGDVGATAFNYTSDRSLKKNIKTISNPVDKIMNLRGVSFNWKDNGQASLGLIAQEVEKVFPELVTGDGLKSVQYGNLVAPLIEAVKEQQREIELLNKRIEALEARK